jgi:thiol-disulfide isomerase/thioredoxin
MFASSISTQYSVLGTRYLCAAVAVLGIATAGCHSPPPIVNLVIGDAKALDAMIAKHKGDVVFVDYWATWCGPCVEGFPHTVTLAERYGKEGLATIAVNFDHLEDESKVREFLAEQGADFENLLSKHDHNQKSAVDFDIEPLPQYRLYDRQGKLRGKWEGKTKEIEEQIEAQIKDLLAEKA